MVNKLYLIEGLVYHKNTQKQGFYTKQLQLFVKGC